MPGSTDLARLLEEKPFATDPYEAAELAALWSSLSHSAGSLIQVPGPTRRPGSGPDQPLRGIQLPRGPRPEAVQDHIDRRRHTQLPWPDRRVGCGRLLAVPLLLEPEVPRWLPAYGVTFGPVGLRAQYRVAAVVQGCAQLHKGCLAARSGVEEVNFAVAAAGDGNPVRAR